MNKSLKILIAISLLCGMALLFLDSSNSLKVFILATTATLFYLRYRLESKKNNQ